MQFTRYIGKVEQHTIKIDRRLDSHTLHLYLKRKGYSNFDLLVAKCVRLHSAVRNSGEQLLGLHVQSVYLVEGWFEEGRVAKQQAKILEEAITSFRKNR